LQRELVSEEHVLESRRVYDGRVVSLRVDTIRRGDGAITEREIVEHNGAVAMVALDQEGNVYLVRQYRAAAGLSLLELPAGTLEPGETPEACARRELQEEIGFIPGGLKRLGGFYAAPGYTTEYIHVYLATDLHPSRLPTDADEDIAVERLPFGQALSDALSARANDSKTIVGLVWAARHLENTDRFVGSPPSA
jgi:ADP-ribose pyrophosphatase